MTSTPNTVSGLNLGDATLTSPLQRRYRTTRRSTLSGEALNAIHVSNEINGEEGNQIPLPNAAPRNLFGTAPQVPPPSAPQVVNPSQPIVTVPAGRTITIDGRPMTLATSPADKATFVVPRLWDKTSRDQLDPEQKQIFVKAATGYVLNKTNKLSVLSTKEDDDGILKHTHNLRTQLKTLEDHAINHDIVDVFTIVSAHDILQTGAVHANPDGGPQVYNLFTDYPRLHLSEVANSNAWYNTWLVENHPYLKENMHYTFEMLRHNTEDTLWSKCMEDYEEFHPIQQGGPLMLYLILKRIQASSEAAVEYLKQKVLTIKISEVEGENVDTVVSLIKSAYHALLSASTPTRSYIPDDLPLKIMEVCQTSSNVEFNKVFADEISVARRQADKYGGIPNWNPIPQTLNLASSTYRRLKLSGEWDIPKKRSAAFVADAGTEPTAKRQKCWNCDQTGHVVSDCPEPPNQAKIEKNKKLYYDARRQERSRNWPRHKTAKDGSKLVLNSKGYYVHDVKATSKAEKRAERKQKAAAKAEAKAKSMADRITDTVSSFMANLHVVGPGSAPTGTATVPANASIAQSITPDLAAHRAALRESLLADLKGN